MDDPPDQRPLQTLPLCHYYHPPTSFIESKLASFVQLAANPAICVVKLSTSFCLLLVLVGVKDLTDINTYK